MLDQSASQRSLAAALVWNEHFLTKTNLEARKTGMNILFSVHDVRILQGSLISYSLLLAWDSTEKAWMKHVKCKIRDGFQQPISLV